MNKRISKVPYHASVKRMGVQGEKIQSMELAENDVCYEADYPDSSMPCYWVTVDSLYYPYLLSHKDIEDDD